MSGTATLLAALRLASPALPIGGFSYSQGLETAIERGWVKDAESAQRWLADCLVLNIGRFEAPLVHALCCSVAAQEWSEAIRLNDWYLASRETSELRAETLQMGYSLLQILHNLYAHDPSRLPLPAGLESGADGEAGASMPYAWALASRSFGLPPAEALTAYLWAWLENQVMVTMKAVPLGQQAGQRVLSGLIPLLEQASGNAAGLPEDDWSNFAPGFALASSWHETQYSRMFRS